MSTTEPRGPLTGTRVLDIGVLVAGPFAAAILGDFGAEVIKIEDPTRPDPMRGLYPKDGVGLFSKVEDRNKLPITLNLKAERGKQLFAQLIQQSDVLVENYRPGVLERLGFDDDRLRELNPDLISCRVSGFGQTGPWRERRAFGRIAEAFGGFANLNGEADGQPMHTAVSLGDSLGSVWAVIGVLLALLARKEGGGGQTVDIALVDAVVRQIEQQLIVWDQLQLDLTRNGNRNPGVPTVNLYETVDGSWFSVASATDATIRGLLAVVGLTGHPTLGTPEGVRANAEGFHEHVSSWMRSRTGEEIDDLFAGSGAVGTLVRRPSEIVDHPQVVARGLIETVDDPDLGPVRMQSVVPKLTRTPGGVRWPGRATGSANEYVYGTLLGLTAKEQAVLHDEGVV